MSLEPGVRLGPYEVISLLGSGGMGEVHRARDTKLNRDVALKVLPEAFALDPERLIRFRREAQVLASLNHPNIGAIYGLEGQEGRDGQEGVQALVLELVEGPTLADRIADGPLPLDEAVPIAKQIADALEAAHEQGIVHRDLKPANIKLRPDGTVKVLDFGLAKLVFADATDNVGKPRGAAGPSASPTITSPALMTGVGVMLGTAAYMSPEQAKGRAADKRSDIWAFGAVLYEILTGRRAFDADDVSETLAAVLMKEPDWSRVPATVPPALRALLQGCLVKDRNNRVGDIASAIFALRYLAGPVDDSRARRADTLVRPWWKRALPVATAGVVGAGLAGGALWGTTPPPPSSPVAKFSFTLPEDQDITNTRLSPVGVSPDGTQLVYSANNQLYLRPVADTTARPIAGSQAGTNATNAVFSPDGQSIAYWNGSVKILPISGGTPLTVANIRGNNTGLAWDESGIVYSGGIESAGWRIERVAPLPGSIPETLVVGPGNEPLHSPQILPGGQHLLFSLAPGPERYEESRVIVQSLKSGERTTVLEKAGGGARYVSSGHLIYASGGTVLAVPFDVTSLAVRGVPAPVIAGVRRGLETIDQLRLLHLAVSNTGTAFYVPGPAGPISTRIARSIVLTRGTKSAALPIDPGPYVHPRVSRDGRWLTYGRDDGSNADIWVYELGGTAVPRRLTLAGNARFPVWSGNGQFVAFQSDHEGDSAIFRKRADGTGVVERLTRPETGTQHVPETWSPNGLHLLYRVVKNNTHTLWDLTVGGTPTPYGDVQSAEPTGAVFSPDGRWVAYAVAEGGGPSERAIFIQPYPATGTPYPAPKNIHELHPAWSADGATLFYVPTGARPVVRMTVQTRGTVAFGPPKAFEGAPWSRLGSEVGRGYDVLPDGGFVSVTEYDPAAGPLELRVILNWHEELRRLAPTR